MSRALLILLAAVLFAGSKAYGQFTIQEGNEMQRTELTLERSPQLLDNRIGGDFGSDGASADGIFDLGLKWLRVSFWDSAFNWQRVRRGPDEFVVDPKAIEWLESFTPGGVTLVVTMGVGDGVGREDDMWRMTDAAIDDYREYVRAVVRSLKHITHYFEIWNEPDTGTPWGGIPAADYSRLVSRVAPAIREEDPDAKVVIGAIGGFWMPTVPGYGDAARFTLHQEYLYEVLANGSGRLADVISWHPFYGHRPDDPYYRDYPTMVEHLMEYAEGLGFTGEYLAEEALWRTVPAGEPQAPVSGVMSAKYIARSMVMHLGMDVIITVSGMFPGECPKVTRGLCTVLAGAEPIDMAPEITADAEHVRHYAFAFANGDHVIAVWTDGFATDEDATVLGDLTCGTKASKATAIDVLHGYEQPLNLVSVNGETSVRGLAIPDYPILIRLTP